MALDTAYFDQVDHQLNQVSARLDAIAAAGRSPQAAESAAITAAIQQIVDQTFPRLSAQYAGQQTQVAQLAPAVALLSLNPTDLPGVLSFITNLVEHYLTPQLAPYIAAEAQLIATVARVASLVSHIESVASRVPGFTPSIPSFP